MSPEGYKTRDSQVPSDPFQLFHERLLRLPENIFLDLARNYLGDIQTPFNKHEILGRMETWLRSPEVQERTAGFLSLRERRILTVIRLLGCATEDVIYAFVGADYSRLDFHLKLLNLEDRLLVFRDPESPPPLGFRLVPHFQSVLEPFLDRSLLIPSHTASNIALPCMGMDHLIAAAAASLDGMALPISRKGEFKKRERQELLACFAPLIQDRNLDESGAERFLHHLIRGLHHLGLIHVQGGKMWSSQERLTEFASLGSSQRRILFCAAALYPEPERLKRNPEDDNPEYFSLSRIHDFAQAQEAFLQLFDPAEIYEPAALGTLSALAGNFKTGISVTEWTQGLSELDRLQISPQGWQVVVWPGDVNQTAQARVEGNFGITLMGSPSLKDLLPLIQSARLETFGASSRWVLDKTRVQHFLARGGSLDDLDHSLKALGSASLPQNVAFSLKAWAEDQESLEFMEGILVVAKGKRQALLEHLPGLEPWIIARPAPGMLLLDRSGQDSWLKVMKEAELSTSVWEARQKNVPSMLPQFLSLNLKAIEPGNTAPNPAVLLNKADSTTAVQETQAQEDSLKLPPHSKTSTQPASIRPGIIHDLLPLAETLEIPEDVKDEIRQRIRDGLILFPQQIIPQVVRVERLEAGGLDFQAKKRVIEQVIKSRRDFLELSLLGGSEFSEPLVVLPTQLKASGTEYILLAQTVPEGRELSLMVRKILRLRRVRSGFFF